VAAKKSASSPKVTLKVKRGVARTDGWENATTGMGTARDKTMAGYYMPDATLNLDWQQLEALYYGDDVAARIVDALVDDSFRKGFCLDFPDDPEMGSDFYEWAQDTFDVNGTWSQAAKWGRLYGGSILIVGADDGQELDQPLNLNRVRDVTWLLPVDSRFATPLSLYTALGPKLGKVEVYQVTMGTGSNMTSVRVHESRCIRFGGVPVDWQRARRLNFWDQTVLQQPYEAMRKFAQDNQAASVMLADASQGVFKIQGLISMLAGNQRQKLHDRMTLVDMSRSTARAVLLDAEKEDFTKVATSFAGLPDMLDRSMQRLSQATGMPVSILMGRSAAGMNATGDLDLASWYQQVSSYQSNKVTRPLSRLLTLLSMAKSCPARGRVDGPVKTKWHPLYVPTNKEDAEAYKTRAEADNIYITAAVLDPAQVAISRFGGRDYSTGSIKVDVEALEAELEAKANFEPPPPGTLPPAPDPKALPAKGATAEEEPAEPDDNGPKA
jgi:phage-related protein (TIGR01555 family)